MKKLLLTGLTLTAAGMLAACVGGKAADQTSAAADSKEDTKQEHRQARRQRYHFGHIL